MSRQNFDVVAYNYPGWHISAWKPFDEWELLNNKKSYFLDHPSLDIPLSGYYDDRLPETLADQMAVAQAYGVGAFTFFLYYGPEGFVLDGPTRTALELASQSDGFQVGFTWCMRLPHQYFPIPLVDDNAPLASSEPRRDVQLPVDVMLGDVVPTELMDTGAVTFARLVAGKPAPGSHEIGGTVDNRPMLAGSEAVYVQEPGPMLSEVVTFIERMIALQADRSWRTLDLLAVESTLARCGLLDLKLQSTKVLCEFASLVDHSSAGRETAKRLPIASILAAFTEATAYIDAADIRHIAALGACATDTAEVFSIITFGTLVEGLREPALRALSLRQIRIALEGIAHDLSQERKP